MFQYITRRLLALIPLVLVISALSFGLYHLAPGDPVKSMLPRELAANPAEVARVKAIYGLDQPLPVQYVRWLGQAVKGNLGYSLNSSESVMQKLGRAVPNSLKLSIIAFVVSTALAIILGVISATRRYSVFDQLATLFSFVGIAAPSFWIATLLVYIFAVKLKVLPATSMYTPGKPPEFWDGLLHMILPVTVMAIPQIASISRFVRSSLMDVLKADYIRTAKAKGLSERVMIFKHALRNSLIPVITIIGLDIPAFVSGAVIIERIFAWPGMGRVTVDAVFSNDYPVVMGANLLFAGLTVLGSLIADVLYAVADPRVKFS
jgi:peptide/nickel transport system permease protein